MVGTMGEWTCGTPFMINEFVPWMRNGGSPYLLTLARRSTARTQSSRQLLESTDSLRVHLDPSVIVAPSNHANHASIAWATVYCAAPLLISKMAMSLLKSAQVGLSYGDIFVWSRENEFDSGETWPGIDELLQAGLVFIDKPSATPIAIQPPSATS